MALLPLEPSLARPVGDPVHQLGGETTFTATTTSKTLIRFPRPVTLFKDLDLDIDGQGRVFGFLMRKVGDFEQPGLRPVIDAITIGQCSERGCKGEPGFTFISSFNAGRKWSGLWELYVVADSAPVAITFTIKRESGEATIPVTGSVVSEIRTLTPRVHESGTNTIYSAGDFSKLDHVDRGMVGLWIVGAPHAATAFGDCLYYGKYRPPEGTEFVPGCPTGDSVPDVWPLPNADGGGVILTSGAWGGARGVGGWYASASAVKRYGAVGFWIDF